MTEPFTRIGYMLTDQANFLQRKHSRSAYSEAFSVYDGLDKTRNADRTAKAVLQSVLGEIELSNRDWSADWSATEINTFELYESNLYNATLD